MSRDLNIYAIDVEKEKLNISSSNQLNANMGNDLLDSIANLGYEDFEENGIIELITYRSKDNGLAIAQILNDYLENNYGQSDSYNNIVNNYPDVLFNKQSLLDFLEWLILLAQKLPLKNTEKNGILIDKVNGFIDEAANKEYLAGQEFTFFSVNINLYYEWYQTIKKSRFQLFYWEDSY